MPAAGPPAVHGITDGMMIMMPRAGPRVQCHRDAWHWQWHRDWHSVTATASATSGTTGSGSLSGHWHWASGSLALADWHPGHVYTGTATVCQWQCGHHDALLPVAVPLQCESLCDAECVHGRLAASGSATVAVPPLAVVRHSIQVGATARGASGTVA